MRTTSHASEKSDHADGQRKHTANRSLWTFTRDRSYPRIPSHQFRGDVISSISLRGDARTECPYKGRTTAYWSVSAGGKSHADLAWSYAFPTRQLLPIAGLVPFLKEKVDVFVDGVEQQRPSTHMS